MISQRRKIHGLESFRGRNLSRRFGVRNFRLNNGWVSEPVKNTRDSIQQQTYGNYTPQEIVPEE